MVEKKTKKFIKILHSDQWEEYRLGIFIKYCKDHEILQQFTTPYTRQQNFFVERRNKTLVECAWSVVKGKNLSKA